MALHRLNRDRWIVPFSRGCYLALDVQHQPAGMMDPDWFVGAALFKDSCAQCFDFHDDQALAREAAKAVWRLTDYGVKKIFNVLLSRGMTPSDYSRSQIAQAVAILKDQCPAERHALLQKELQGEE